MMAHVAEASEASGRVLFVIEPGSGDISIPAQVTSRFASAFNAEIETVIVNTDALDRACSLPVAAWCPARPNSAANEAPSITEYVLLQMRQLRAIERAARRQGVPVYHTAVTGQVIDQLDGLCLSRGPWNVVVLSRPACEASGHAASTIFANVSGATGVVAAPKRIAHDAGPIAIVVEDAERLPAMLRAASRLKGLCGRVHVLVAADRRKDMEELEAHIRLTTANHRGLVVETASPVMGVAGALDEALRGLKTSFIVARLGGTLLPNARALARTVALAQAPVLLVR
ncbi:MAG: hypothetical protein AB7S74_08740 [Hyphomicrobium sp.]